MIDQKKLDMAAHHRAIAAQYENEAYEPLKADFIKMLRQKREKKEAKRERFAGIIHSLHNEQGKPVTNTKPVSNVKPVATTFKTKTPPPILKKVKGSFNMADAELKGPLLDLFEKYKNGS